MSVSEADLSDKYVMTDSATLFKILQALSFKGGSASTPSLKIAVMLEDNVIKAALKAGHILNVIEEDDDEHALTADGERVLEVSKKEQQDIISKNLLAIEGYRDIVFRLKMTPKHEMAMKDISKAFYILEKDMREELRKAIIDAFIDFGIFSNMFENNNNAANPGIILTSNGERQLTEAIDAKKRKKKGGSAAAPASGGSTAIVSDLNCGSCGKAIMPDFNLCPYCGTALKRSCANCGKELQPGWKMCPFCGSSA